MWLDNLVSSAWYTQKRQAINWLQGDAFKGAAAALQTLVTAHNMTIVRKCSGQHIKANLVVLLAMLIFSAFLHSAANICCQIMKLLAIDLNPPSLLCTFTWAAWIQVGFWSILLRYYFHQSTEECFYMRLAKIDYDGLCNVQTWPTRYSIMTETWSSIKRTFRSLKY